MDSVIHLFEQLGPGVLLVKLESNKDVALQDRRTSELNSLFKQVDERRKVI